MEDRQKTKDELINELIKLREQVSILESSQTKELIGKKSCGNFSIETQRLLDALPFYVLLIDENHHILFANKAVRLYLGKEPKDIIGGYCPKVIHRVDEPIPCCPLEESVKTGRAVEREYFDSDHMIWLSSVIYPSEYKTKDGRTVYFHTVRDITEQKSAEEKLNESFNKLHVISQSIINAITVTVEKRDPYTSGHQQRVSRLASEIAIEMNMSDEQVRGIRIAGLVHDIGKIAIPIEILSKPGKINIHEYNIIKSHSEIGYDILKGIEFPWPIAQTILQHHERLDGSGYPNGLKGEDTLLEARILSVADVVEAMASHRPYRKALGIEVALGEISNGRGILYDAQVADACLKVFEKGISLE